MNKSNILILGLLAMFVLISSCKRDKDEEEFSCVDYHWEYEGEAAPETWGTCAANCGGLAQSPVNITEAIVDANLNALTTNYQNAPIELAYNGHTIQFDYKAGSSLTLNGETFNLLQFHFHTKSEHTINGEQYPMEVHLVHQNPDTDDLAVIGIFFEEGSENAFLANFSDNLPETENSPLSLSNEVNATDLLPSDMGYYTYTGSLTTPPCSEIVTWLVMKTPVQASSTQINAMHNIIQDNFRPVQALNGREVKEFL